MTVLVLLSCTSFYRDIAHFSFKALTPIQSLVLFYWNHQNLLPSKAKNNEAAGTGRAVYTKERNPQDLKVNHFYVPDLGSLSHNALHIWSWQVENDACSSCYPAGPLKLMCHGYVETLLPHLQHLHPFITVQVCSWGQNQCIHAGCILCAVAFCVCVTCLGTCLSELSRTLHCVVSGGLSGSVCLHSAWVP